MLVVSCALSHFIHDSTTLAGFRWLAPFNKEVYVTFHYVIPRLIDDVKFREGIREINRRLDESGSVGEELAAHDEPTTVWHVRVWLIAVGLFFCWVLL